MEFGPNNDIVKLCMTGMSLVDQNLPVEASDCFQRAWSEAEDEHEKFLAAYFLAGIQSDLRKKVEWLESMLGFALKLQDDSTKCSIPPLYMQLSDCYANLGDDSKSTFYADQAASYEQDITDAGPFFHGTKADLKVGDLLEPGKQSNYTPNLVMNHIYFTASLNGAGLAAALAAGNGKERVYLVEPMGSFEHDPNVTNKKFPGNMTRSYRSLLPLKIIDDLSDWSKLSAEELQGFKRQLAKNKGDIIN